MPSPISLFLSLLVVCGITIIACEDPGPKAVRPPITKQVNCTLIPEAKRDLVAKLMIECVNNATAKNTGENQDADDWVDACKENLASIYQVIGFKNTERPADGGYEDWHDVTPCMEFYITPSTPDTLTKAE